MSAPVYLKAAEIARAAETFVLLAGDVYAEAKAVGYDVRIIRKVVQLRAMRPNDRREMEAVLETYKAALGLA